MSLEQRYILQLWLHLRTTDRNGSRNRCHNWLHSFPTKSSTALEMQPYCSKARQNSPTTGHMQILQFSLHLSAADCNGPHDRNRCWFRGQSFATMFPTALYIQTHHTWDTKSDIWGLWFPDSCKRVLQTDFAVFRRNWVSLPILKWHNKLGFASGRLAHHHVACLHNTWAPCSFSSGHSSSSYPCLKVPMH